MDFIEIVAYTNGKMNTRHLRRKGEEKEEKEAKKRKKIEEEIE